jgi:hypothetical protein
MQPGRRSTAVPARLAKSAASADRRLLRDFHVRNTHYWQPAGSACRRMLWPESLDHHRSDSRWQ